MMDMVCKMQDPCRNRYRKNYRTKHKHSSGKQLPFLICFPFSGYTKQSVKEPFKPSDQLPDHPHRMVQPDRISKQCIQQKSCCQDHHSLCHYMLPYCHILLISFSLILPDPTSSVTSARKPSAFPICQS